MHFLKLIIILIISCNLFAKDKTKKDLTYTDFAYLLNEESQCEYMMLKTKNIELVKRVFTDNSYNLILYMPLYNISIFEQKSSKIKTKKFYFFDTKENCENAKEFFIKMNNI